MSKIRTGGMRIKNTEHKDHLKVRTSIKFDMPKIDVAKTQILEKGVNGMKLTSQHAHSTCLSDIKNIIQSTMKAQGLSPEEAIKSIGERRYEK